MVEFTAVMAATLVTVPLIALYVVYFIAVKASRNKMLSFKFAVDVTVVLFIVSVYFLFLEIWSVRTGGWMILFILLTAVLFTFFHWKNHDDIHIRKVLKGVWRFQFVVFLVLYFLLLIYGMADRIMT